MPAKLLFTLLCDDVREEKSGKLSLIGVYNYSIGFQAPPPAQLPSEGPVKFLLPQLCILHRWSLDAAGKQSIFEIADERGTTLARLEVALPPAADDGFIQAIIRLVGVTLEKGRYEVRTSCDGFVFTERFEVKILPT